MNELDAAKNFGAEKGRQGKVAEVKFESAAWTATGFGGFLEIED